jgi:hypothetical protein
MNIQNAGFNQIPSNRLLAIRRPYMHTCRIAAVSQKVTRSNPLNDRLSVELGLRTIG